MIRRLCVLLCLWVSLPVAPVLPASAQASPEVVQRLQQLLQEATRARATLERDKVRLEKEVSTLEKQVARLEKSSASLKTRLERSTAESAALGQEAQSSKQDYAVLKARFEKVVSDCRESLYQMRDIELERNRFVTRVADRNGELGACVDANAQLRDLNEEILQQYESDGRGGAFQSVAKREPFTRLSRVRLQNALDDYRYEASELEILAPEDLLRADQTGELTIDERWLCTDTRPPPERPPIP